jgi:dienelactone hydrolase
LPFTCCLAFSQTQDARITNAPFTDTHFTSFEPGSLQQWEARKAHLKKQILFAAGLLPMPARTPLNPQVFGRIDRKGYTIEKVLLETMPGYYLGGNLYRPGPSTGEAQSRGTGLNPAVLVAHGHWLYGRLENQPLFSGPALASTLARMGYVVFAYDMVGYNDTSQTPHQFGDSREQLWSFTPLGLQLWNSIRALDFLGTLNGVDPAHIAMTGASGGGTQTFLLTAVDDRIKVSAPVNMVSAEMQGGDVCENAPGLRFGTFNVEIAAMAAPRPLLLVSTSGDWTHNVPNFEFPAIQKVYALFGETGIVQNKHLQFPEHNFNAASRQAVYQFFRRYLSGSDAQEAIAEEQEEPPKLQDMLALYGRNPPAGAKSYDQVFSTWRDAGQQSLTTVNVSELRDELRWALGVELPEQVQSTGNGDALILSRPGQGDRLPARWYPGRGQPVLLLGPEGSASAVQSDAFRRLRAEGRPVLSIDAFQTGAKTAPRKRPEFYLAFNRSDDQNRMQDVMTALAFLQKNAPGVPEVIGFGRARIWALFAAAVSAAPVKIQSIGGAFSGTDAEYLRDFFIPGIQRAGGLGSLLTVLAASGADRNDGGPK